MIRDRESFFWIETGEGSDGLMEIRLKQVSGKTVGSNRDVAAVSLCLRGREQDGTGSFHMVKQIGIRNGEFRVSCPGVRLWDPEHPCLYRLSVTVQGTDGPETVQEQKVGFRVLERKGKQLLWNHRPLKLKGVCYRERKGDLEGTKQDLTLFYRANINFIRSIYAPFSEEMLELCDEMGFLVENTAPFYEIGQAKAAAQDLPHLREAFLEPVREMMLKGAHTSVLIWSLGHDCAWGANFREAAAYIRGLDRVRPLTFHLPMSVPEEEEPLDIWPVHYVDWQQPFDVCFDQMVIFHTPGAENEIGYMTGQASYEMPVLHEVWSPVACHNRDEIEQDPYIRQFWGESILRFAEKAYRTPGCLGGAVLAGVDEDGSFEDMGQYEWGILDKNHCPKPEYEALRRAYTPVALKSLEEKDGHLVVEVENRFLYTDLDQCRMKVDGRECSEVILSGEPGSVTMYRIALKDMKEIGKTVSLVLESGDGSREYISYQIPVGEKPEYQANIEGQSLKRDIGHGSLTIEWKEQTSGKNSSGKERSGLLVGNDLFTYEFSGETCLLVRAAAGGRRILAGGPYLNCTGFLLGRWNGKGLDAAMCGDKVQVTICGSYENSLDICFRLMIAPDGTLDTSYEVIRLCRHMPHTVKAEIGVATGGINEKGVSYLLAEGMRCCEEEKGGRFVPITDEEGNGVILCLHGEDRVRLEKAPWLTPEAVINDRNPRMEFTGSWYGMDDYCGNYEGTETLSKEAGDTMSLVFEGSGIRLYGPLDMIYGMCDIYLDGVLAAEAVSQFPDKVDFPGMSRGYEKRYGQIIFEAHHLQEGEHRLLVRVSGKGAVGAQNTYTSIDYAVLEGRAYQEGIRVNVIQDYNYSRLVRGCYRRPRVDLIPGAREGFCMKLLIQEYN